ncbi:putative retroelement pol polyprotein [Cucumis melo var. makuwa]|uniref:Retroelement pol polyprotein n=1 Tax=Cucumis melo var. makuwa TaxID=1194695 RepID=A0A5A7UV74_CUCMM|nr:putative retroelement pol polyprotein [Cucumis melo var. makuwa]
MPKGAISSSDAHQKLLITTVYIPLVATRTTIIFVQNHTLLKRGARLNRSSAYHPQSDGQTEVVNQIVEAYLHCFCGERPKERTLRLQLVEYGYNTTYQISIGITPFQAIYGHLPPPLLYYGESTTVNTTLDQQSRERDDALQVLKEHLQVAQDQMKKFPDKKRREVEFQLAATIHPIFHVSQLKQALGQHHEVQSMLPYPTC